MQQNTTYKMLKLVILIIFTYGYDIELIKINLLCNYLSILMGFFSKFPNLNVIISCFFWGTYWIPLRYIDRNNNSSLWPIFFSFLLISIFLIRPLFRKISKLNTSFNLFFILGCVLAAIAISLYSESLLRGEIAKVVVLFYLCPIWGTIFSRIFLKQQFSLNRFISLILGLAGLAIIIGLDKGNFFPTTLVEYIALLAGISWALSMTFFNLASPTTAFDKTSLTCLFVPFVFLILAFIPEGRSIKIYDNIFSIEIIYLWIFLFSLVWLLPSILLTYFSVEVLDPGRINILLAFEVVVGIFTAALLTNEIITIREILGALFVISSCFTDVLIVKTKKL